MAHSVCSWLTLILMVTTFRTLLALLLFVAGAHGEEDTLPPVRLAKTGRGFEAGGQPLVPWGFNYDHDDTGRLIEDYWDKEWSRVEQDFREMRDLEANVVRVHLQLGRFMCDRNTPNEDSLRRLGELLKLAQRERFYLDITGLGCYHKADVPPWYDRLKETERWDVQANFWEAIARCCAGNSAVFCYDLMNEPVVAGARRKDGEWLGGAFGGKHFVQFITLDAAGRPRPEIARDWTRRLVAAIRKHDRDHLITVGLVDWSLDRPGLTSGFVPKVIALEVDFLAVHLYPERGKIDDNLKTLEAFAAVGKPVLIEETFPLKAGLDEFARFIAASRQHAAGHLGFYWGRAPTELRPAKTIADAMMLSWLEYFQREAKK